MTKLFSSPIAIALLGTAAFYASCKKPHHDNHPAVNNFRMLSYTKTTFQSGGSSNININDNYTFYYDDQQRVKSILHTVNDMAATNETFDFVYSTTANTVYKYTTNNQNKTITEIDTFVRNSANLVTAAYYPNRKLTFDYYGKLLANVTEAVYTNHIKLEKKYSYTSYNGDFLKHYYEGNVRATFTDLQQPIDVTWNEIGQITPLTTNHNGLNSSTDQIADRYGYDISIGVIDNFLVTDGITFPKMKTYNENYDFYTQYTNRDGDYLHILSMTEFGSNIYQNAHMVEKIYNSAYTWNIDYDVDSYSRTTQARVTTTDSTGTKLQETYTIQYESFE